MFALLAAFMLLSHSIAYSQHPLYFDRITQREGLSNSSVFAICQDVCGAMWFAADDGVERYDGYGFRAFKIGGVYALCADDRGYVWIGSPTNGVYCYDIARDTLISLAATVDDPHRELHNRVGSFYLDQDGVLWVGLDVGLARFDTKKRQYLNDLQPSATQRSISSIVDDHAGSLWLGSCCGIVKFEKGNSRSTFYQYDLSSTVKVNLAFGRDGKLWMNGGNVAGLVCFDTTYHKWSRILCNGVAPNASNVLVDDVGRVWVASGSNGLKIYDPRSGSWEEFHHRSSDPQSLSSDRIGIIYCDKVGNMWFGTRDGVSKLARWRKQFWAIPHNTDDPNSPPKVSIRSISEDLDGNLWIASRGDGVKVWNRHSGTFKAIGGIGEYVNVVHADRSGWIWIGTENPDCVTAINPSTGQRSVFRHDPKDSLSIPAGPVLSLHEDPDGSLWVGTGLLGIGCVDRQTGKCQRLKLEFLPDGYPVRSFYRDKPGKLWASVGNLLVEVIGKADHARVLTIVGNLQSWERGVTAMFEDREGRFYVGTHGGFGLLDRSTGKLTHLRHDDQRFQSSATYGIVDDEHRDLWLMTAKGVTRFQPETNKFTDFGYAEGFPPVNLAVNIVYGTSSFCRTKDGFLVMGTGEGIVIFHPDSIHTNPNPPNVIITNIKVAGVPAHLGMIALSARRAFEFRPMELLHDENTITFEFAALDYTAPSQNLYAHKLEGLDDTWSPANNDRRVEYANLSPGDYIFRVKAANNDGVWNEEGAFVKITILPPWWMTWWFRALAVMVCAGLIILTMRFRIRRAVAQERMRWQIASDLHDDIGSSLSSIALVSENVRNTLGKDHPALREIDSVTSAARQAADRLKDDVWVIKPGSDSLENLLLRMKDVTQAVIGHMKYSFNADTNGISRQVPIEFRRNVLFIYKEALHNVLKHSCASTVEISVTLTDGSFILDVRDDGRGFDGDEESKGNGLINMRSRSDALKGDLLIKSAINRGTHIHLNARIP